MDWYWRMPLQSALTELAPRCGDLQQAGVELQGFVEASLATEELTWQALSWEAGARVTLAGSDSGQAEHCIRKAISILQSLDLPLAFWRVHATAMKVFPAAAEEHRRFAASGILRLAESLKEFPALRETFLSSDLACSVDLRLSYTAFSAAKKAPDSHGSLLSTSEKE